MIFDSSQCATKAPSGVLLVDKPPKVSSFACVHAARKRFCVEKIGHAGTLDPFATGLLILLVGKEWTRQQDHFMGSEKEYEAVITLGVQTDSYDSEGIELARSEKVPQKEEIEEALLQFQGTCLQTPPMFSAKKINGKRLYELARKGIEVDRKPVEVQLKTQLVDYFYPYLKLNIVCSKGTYIRSIGNDLGNILGSYGHVSSLRRTRSGRFSVVDAISLDQLKNADILLEVIRERLFFPVMEKNPDHA